ncbi:MAG: DUF4209 domain-containing protein [Bacteroidota bacterium]
MAVLRDELDPTALGDSGWDRVFDLAKKPTVDSYGGAFRALVEEHEGQDGQIAAFLALLQAICYIMLAPEREEGPYVPMVSGPNGRTPLPEDLSDAELDALSGLFATTDDPELKARLGDFLWLRRQDHKAGISALEAYVSSAKRLEELGEHIYVGVRFERAIELAARFSGKRRDYLSEVLDEVAGVVRSRYATGTTTRTLGLIDLLLERNYGDAGEWAALSKDLAEQLESSGEYHIALEYWGRAVRAYGKASDSSNAREASVRRADAYLRLADDSPTEMGKSSFVRSAYEAYRQIPGTEAKREELHRRLLQHQEKAVGEFGTISTPVDLGDAPDQAREAVKGQDLIQALYSLSLLLAPTDPAKLRDQAERSAKDHPLMFMLHRERVNALGRVVGVKPSGIEDPEGALISTMHDDLNRRHQLDVSALINPARLQILADHPAVRVADLERLVNDNGFIPPDRRFLFARGLTAGLKGDFAISAHLLIPQIENSLRVTLQRMGVITTGLNSANRRQNEQSLNVTLYDYQGELESVFGAAVIIELQNLLVEPLGSNLRNEAMHGLMNDGAFFSHPMVYLWWLTLRLCCFGNQGPLPDGFSRVE